MRQCRAGGAERIGAAAHGHFPKQIPWFSLLNLHIFLTAGTSPPPLTRSPTLILKPDSKEPVAGLTKSSGPCLKMCSVGGPTVGLH